MNREQYKQERLAYLNDSVNGITITLATDEAAVVVEALGVAVYAGNWDEQDTDTLVRVITDLTGGDDGVGYHG